MTEPKKEENNARLSSGRAFLSRTEKLLRCTPFRRGITIPGLKAQLIFWPLMAAGMMLDLWSKRAVFQLLQQEQNNSISIIDGFLHLVEARNTGAAFGIAAGQRYFLTGISVIALVVIFWIFLFSGTERRLVHIALGLFASGVCGNLYDRIFNNDGAVRDFIDVVYWPGKHWPAFNVADSLLCIGVGLMIISCFFTGKSSPERVQQQK
jgi:signal peptidase II